MPGNLPETKKSRGSIQKETYSNGINEMTDELHEKIIEIVSSCKDMAISTVREDGWPQVNTVSFVNMGPDIYFETSKYTSKAKNIARDPRVSIAIWPFYERFVDGCGISLAGYAEGVNDEAVAREFHRLLLEKTPELANITDNDGNKVFPDPNMILYHIRMTMMSVLDFSKGFGHADLVLFDDSGNASRA
ncbi:pyridoxamine 5'-phosphate oxidase family protein [Methanolobus sp. WCC4]|uniref:pyridoxamine 5'-phosphate oxidase family protein n=1 Tax=Methanolobus sp. WCC4 TaxID=3125784 RepID=UPI0030FB07EF